MQEASIDPHTERAARAFMAKIASQYSLAGAILFGSRARQNHRPDSDADIAVLLRGRRDHFLDTKLALGGHCLRSAVGYRCSDSTTSYMGR